MLTIDSVSLSFNGRSVLSGCYLECRKPEVVGLLGRNGCGKSSLLKIIFGTLKADFKHMRIDERIIRKGFLTKKLAYLPQQNFLPPFLKVSDILASLPRAVKERVLERTALEERVNFIVSELSGGEQRLTECLWILYQPAEYILLDEPFSALSPLYIELLQQLITEEGKEKGIILTDHMYRPLLQVAGRIVLLHNNAVYGIKEETDLVRYNYIPDFS